jgi:hypothetical protein
VHVCVFGEGGYEVKMVVEAESVGMLPQAFMLCATQRRALVRRGAFSRWRFLPVGPANHQCNLGVDQDGQWVSLRGGASRWWMWTKSGSGGQQGT